MPLWFLGYMYLLNQITTDLLNAVKYIQSELITTLMNVYAVISLFSFMYLTEIIISFG